MTEDVMCCAPDTDVEAIGARMKDSRVRRVPVCDADGAWWGSSPSAT